MHMSSLRRKCETCGRTRPDTAVPCPICGAARQTLADGRVLTTYAPTVILGKNDPKTGHQGLVVASSGATSVEEAKGSDPFASIAPA